MDEWAKVWAPGIFFAIFSFLCPNTDFYERLLLNFSRLKRHYTKGLFACSWVSSALAMYSSVMKCYNSDFSDPEMLAFVN